MKIKTSDLFNVLLFGVLWTALIYKKQGVEDWLLKITNDQLIWGIIIPIIIYAVFIIVLRQLKVKYLNEK